MVTILPRQSSALERIGLGLSEAVPNLVQGIADIKQKQAQSEQLKELTGHDIGALSPDLQKIVLADYLKASAHSANAAKLKLKEEQNAKIKNTAQQSWNSAIKLLKKGNLGKGSIFKAGFGGKSGRDVGAFEAIGAGLEPALREALNPNKAMTDVQFKYLTEQIMPKVNDPEQVIAGKLEQIAEILGLDPAELEDWSPARGVRKKAAESVKEREALKASKESKGRKSLEEIFK